MEQSTDPLNLYPHELNSAVYGTDDLPAEFLDSIQQFGIITPLTVLEDNTIISGHRRWLAAKQLGLQEIPVLIVRIEDDLDIAQAIIEANRQREKTFSVKMREAEVLRKIETERAQQRHAATGGRGSKDMCPDTPLGQSRDAVADQVGIGSGRTYDRARTVWDKAQDGNETAVLLVKKIDAGQITIGAAYREIKTSAAEPFGPAEIAPGGWGVNPGELTVHWWERDPGIKALWNALVTLPDIIADAATDNLSDSEQQSLTILVRGTIKELERNWTSTC